MIESLIVSLFLTLVIELTVSIIIGIREKYDIKVVICANVCTNPVVVYIANLIILLNNIKLYILAVAILEISAVIVEFLIFKKYLKFNKISPFLISLLNNVISFGLGLVISYIK